MSFLNNISGINGLGYKHVTDNESWKQIISKSVFDKPLLLLQSAWTEHIPFAFWLIDTLQPAVFVELGTHYGLSYFSFCQAVQKTSITAKCFAIDNWTGDEHAGFYDNAVFEAVSSINENYKDFSVLYRHTFDEAVDFFQDKTIDLLHIDGLHTYEAVKHDFYNWLPKMSDKGVVLFHDTNVMDRGFGVYQLWEELKQQYPSFEFTHGFGLGVLAVGKNIPVKATTLFEMASNPDDESAVQQMYARLGNLILKEQEYERLTTHLHAGVSQTEPSVETDRGASIPDGTEIQKNIPPDNHLHPLQTLSMQLFWATQQDDFREQDSIIQTVELADSKSHYLFDLHLDLSSIHKLRIDPATEQGAFYLHAISITNITGSILLNWDAIKKLSLFHNLVIFKSTLLDDAFVFISISEDPIIEIELPVISYPDKDEGVHFNIDVAGLSNEILNKELLNITAYQLKAGQTNELIENTDTII